MSDVGVSSVPFVMAEDTEPNPDVLAAGREIAEQITSSGPVVPVDESGGDGVRTTSAPPESDPDREVVEGEPDEAPAADEVDAEEPSAGPPVEVPAGEDAVDAGPPVEEPAARFDADAEADLNRWWEASYPDQPRPSVQQMSDMLGFVEWAGNLPGDAGAVMAGWAEGRIDVPGLLAELVARRDGSWRDPAGPGERRPVDDEPLFDDDDPVRGELAALRDEVSRMRADAERREAQARMAQATQAQSRAVDRFWGEHQQHLSVEEAQELQRRVYNRRLADSLLSEHGGDFEAAYHAALETALWADPRMRERVVDSSGPTVEEIARQQRASALSGSGISPVAAPSQPAPPRNMMEARRAAAEMLERLAEAESTPR